MRGSHTPWRTSARPPVHHDVAHQVGAQVGVAGESVDVGEHVDGIAAWPWLMIEIASLHELVALNGSSQIALST
jgi:hypothetical protein